MVSRAEQVTWSQGYVADSTYTQGFYRELTPANLSLIAELAGDHPPDISGSFTYCELGSGFGLTATVVAAAHPQAHVFAVDFNPAHIAGGAMIAREAKVPNLVFLEASFEECVNQPPVEFPKFDFIVLHGIYSWVDSQNQTYLRQFVRQYLKPGGMLYLSYNTNPGWAAMVPVRRLVFDLAARHRGTSGERTVAALREVRTMIDAGATAVGRSEELVQRIDAFLGMNPTYLAHELLNQNWQIMASKDVIASLEAEKLSYLGQAIASESLVRRFLPAALKPFVEAAPTVGDQEMALDFCLNTQFRRDVYMRGRLGLLQMERLQRLRMRPYHLSLPIHALSLDFKISALTVNGAPTTYRPIQEAFAIGPQSIADLVARPGTASLGEQALWEAVTMMTGSGQLSPIPWRTNVPSETVEGCHRLNRVLANRSVNGQAISILAAPRIASAVSAGLTEMAAVAGLLSGVPAEPEPLARAMAQSVLAAGRAPLADGKPVSDPAVAAASLVPNASSFLSSVYPLWRSLGVC